MAEVQNYTIDSEKPISSSNDDMLEFSTIAEDMSNLLINAESGSFIGLNAPWGSGKTSMLNLIKNKLEEEKGKTTLTILFDAWDYENPNGMIPKLLSELGKNIEDSDTRKSWKKVASAVLLGLADITLSTVSSGIIRLENIINTMKEIDDQFDAGRAQNDGSYFGEYFEEIFKNALESTKDQGYKNIIFLIDDLDRCHPENIFLFIDHLRRLVVFMHKFGIDLKIVGMLAFDKQIISTAIHAKYPGLPIDSFDYLMKLTNLTIELPKPKQELLKNLFQAKIDSIGILQSLANSNKENIIGTLVDIVGKDEVSLRQGLMLLRQVGYAKSIGNYPLSDCNNQCETTLLAMGILGIVAPECYAMLARLYKDNTQGFLTNKRNLSDLLKNPATDALSIPGLVAIESNKYTWIEKCNFRTILEKITDERGVEMSKRLLYLLNKK